MEGNQLVGEIAGEIAQKVRRLSNLNTVFKCYQKTVNKYIHEVLELAAQLVGGRRQPKLWYFIKKKNLMIGQWMKGIDMLVEKLRETEMAIFMLAERVRGEFSSLNLTSKECVMAAKVILNHGGFEGVIRPSRNLTDEEKERIFNCAVDVFPKDVTYNLLQE